MTLAQTLIPSARGQLTPAFRQGETAINLNSYLRPVEPPRELPIDDLRRLLEHAMDRFSATPTESDAWLSPRIHALLRLTRGEAGDRTLWGWISAHEFPEFARWRFPGKGEEEEDETRRGTPAKRFTGADRDNALSRLWWGAELCRNGDDYTPATRAFIVQDVPNTWFALDAFHHRPCAQAALRILPGLQGRTVNRLSTALDHVLMTIQLDVVAPAASPDVVAYEEWRTEAVSVEELLEDELPLGPDETPVSKQQINRVEALLRRVAKEIGIEVPAP